MNWRNATDRELQVVLQDPMASSWDIIAAKEEIKRRKPRKWDRAQYKIKEVPAR
ncbi:hypothetical protein NST04_33575 [Paenibacillus sp. FSL H7-0756]|uniref:hypothetical protein n=1 Tax=Paenibacillus sp. FSL H7-0756 TaxID=2954738 RepID=UPI0030F5ACBC